MVVGGLEYIPADTMKGAVDPWWGSDEDQGNSTQKGTVYALL